MEPCSLVDRFGIKQDNVSTFGIWIRDVISVFHVKLFGLFAKKSINFERIEEKKCLDFEALVPCCRNFDLWI